MLKNSFRRTLSVMITLVMIWTTFCIGQPLTASAEVSASTPANVSGVNFVVPEAIYLAPVFNSYFIDTSSTFQWYVNNTMASDGTISTNTGEESTGKIYFKYANASGAKLSFEWLDASGDPTTGGNVKINSTTLEPKVTSTMSISSSNTAIEIKSGTSQSMEKAQTGGYIRWTVTYTDTTDGRQKTVQAYTYIYKPYVETVGVAQRTVNDRGTNHYAQNISWISGVHDTDSSALGTHYPNSDSGHGMLAFSSGDSSSNKPLVGALYAQLSSYFYWDLSDNEGAGGWLTQSSSNMPDKSFRYYQNADTGHSSGDDAFHNVAYSPTAVLTIDVSRYKKLDQIPNLSVGIMVTDDEKSDSGAALFISNYTGDALDQDYKGINKNSTSAAETFWNRFNENDGDIFKGSTYAEHTYSEGEGVKYNGRWTNKSLSSTATGDTTFRLGTGYFNHQGSGSHYGGDTNWNIAELRMKVHRYNKATLRTAVQKAINNSATLQSMFYNTSASAWTNYVNLFHAASLALTKLDGTFSIKANGTTYSDPGTLANKLDGAIDTLLSGSGRKTGLQAKQTNAALQKTANGSYVYASIVGGSSSHTLPNSFKSYDKVEFTADTIPGYTYLGLMSTASPLTPVMGASVTKPTASDFTTSAPGATISNGKVTYIHTDATGTDGSGNLYYTYYYEVNTYSVHFEANGGTGTMDDQAFTYNVAQNLTSNGFTRQGYTFAGWSKTANGSIVYSNGQSVNNLTTAANGTVYLYAQWTTESYDIQYDPNGGTVTGTDYTESYKITDTVKLPSATKEGHTLTGWKANDAGNWGILTYNANSSYSNKYGNVQFTAVWKAINFSVAFDANGGTGAAMADQAFVYGTAQNLTANAYTRAGYTFLGWALSKNATEPVYADKESVQDLTATPGTVTLYAIWSVNNYKITYATDGGTIRDTTFTTDYTVDDAIILPTTVEKTGYTFGSWKAAGNSGTWNTETSYTGTLGSGMTGNVTLTAQWTKVTYTIQYELVDGAIIGTRYTQSYDVTTTIVLPDARKTGYTFAGWLANGGGNWGEIVYQKGNITAGRFNGDVTLTAQWTGVQYYVQFNGNGSTSGMMYNQSFTYGEPAALAPNEYARGGYQFKGWATSATATSALYPDQGVVENPLSPTAGAVVTLYAVWEKEEYTITYDANGGTITNPGTTLYSITDTIQLPTTTYKGYTLNGWRPTENSGSWHTWDLYTGASVAAGCYGDAALQAQWTKDTYTITYDAQEGTMSGNYTTTYDVDTPIVLPSITRTGYNFGGWRASAAWNYMTITNNQAPTGLLGDVTLTALWTQKVYYIHFNANEGVGVMNDQAMRFGESQALSANQFTRDGYSFKGWAGISTATSASYADGDIVLNLSQTDGAIVNLYAVWEARNFSISYSLDGAVNPSTGRAVSLIATTVTMDGAAVSLRAYNLTETTVNGQPGCLFDGWAYSAADAENGVVAYANKASFSLNASVLDAAEIDWTTAKPTITLYAVWRSVNIELIVPEGVTTVIDKERKFIYGLKEGITIDELKNQYLDVTGKGSIEIVTETGFVGTDTIVRLIDDRTEEKTVLEEYRVVVFGDLTGDGRITNSDVAELRALNLGMYSLAANSPYMFAADLTTEGNITNADVQVLRELNLQMTHYDQANRQVID